MATKGSKPKSLQPRTSIRRSTKEHKNPSLGKKCLQGVPMSLSLLLPCSSLEIQAQVFTLLSTFGSFCLWFNTL